MNEKISREVAKAAEVLEMDITEVEQKFAEICTKNDINSDAEPNLALSCFRQWFSGTRAYQDAPAQETTGDSWNKDAFGYFISVDAARDMAAMLNERIKNEYISDNHSTYSAGKVAVALLGEDGYTVSKMQHGEEVSGTVAELPENNFEVDTGKYIVPIDAMPAYGERKNANYGKPLPHEQYRMAGVFVGTVDGDTGLYYFSYKGSASQEFKPTTFKPLQLKVIRDKTNTDRLYGYTNGTLESLLYNSDLDPEHQRAEPSELEMQNHSMEYALEHYTPLIDLNMYHSRVSDKTFAQRFGMTDGTVSSMNMTPNKFGTRRITISDLNSDFDYEGGSWAGTTCWIPSHIDINFGIGSRVVFVGRTAQGRNDDGSYSDVTLNVSGVLCVENRGVVVEPFEAAEEDIDWF